MSSSFALELQKGPVSGIGCRQKPGSSCVEVTFNLEGYWQTTGRVEATQIAKAVRDALHRSESSVRLSDQNVKQLRCETYVLDRDRQGRGHNANVIFTAMLETA